MIRVVGTDVSSDFDSRSCLVLAPHADDETFGCGATIARKRAAGSQVKVVIVTDGSQALDDNAISGTELAAIRQREAVVALSHLGVEASDVSFLGFEDGHLSDHTDEIVSAIKPLIRDASPDQVLVTSVDDRHPDHSTLGHAARIAVDSGDLCGELYEYAIWQRVPAAALLTRATRDAWRQSGSWRKRLSAVRPQLVSTRGHLDQKRTAIAAYESQASVLPLGFVEDFLQRSEVFVRAPKP